MLFSLVILQSIVQNNYQLKKEDPCKDNVSISLRSRQILFTFPAFLNTRINSSFRFLQK